MTRTNAYVNYKKVNEFLTRGHGFVDIAIDIKHDLINERKIEKDVLGKLGHPGKNRAQQREFINEYILRYMSAVIEIVYNELPKFSEGFEKNEIPNWYIENVKKEMVESNYSTNGLVEALSEEENRSRFQGALCAIIEFDRFENKTLGVKFWNFG